MDLEKLRLSEQNILPENEKGSLNKKYGGFQGLIDIIILVKLHFQISVILTVSFYTTCL